MVSNKARGGRELRSAVGMAALVVLLAGGARAAMITVDDSGCALE